MIRMDDGSRPYLSILLIVLLLAGAVYFALAETAFASVSRVRIKARADRGERRAKRAPRRRRSSSKTTRSGKTDP